MSAGRVGETLAYCSIWRSADPELTGTLLVYEMIDAPTLTQLSYTCSFEGGCSGAEQSLTLWFFCHWGDEAAALTDAVFS